MNTENGFLSFRARIVFVLLMGFPLAAHSQSIMVGDIEISPQDFSANLDSEQRIAKCLSCHGHHAAGDIDFGANVRFGTPALRGMREQYLKKSLNDYQAGTRKQKEMSVISALLDEETMTSKQLHTITNRFLKLQWLRDVLPKTSNLMKNHCN